MKFLYHGSNRRIKILRPRKPTDTKKQNSLKAVYATNNKRLALGMGLTNQKGSTSFSTKNPVKINFVKGEPKMKYVYLHHLSANGFKQNTPGQYFSTAPVKPLKIEKYPTSGLSSLWRKSNQQELKRFLKNRK